MSSHTHKYQRAKLGPKYLIYRCMLPGCSHYVPANLVVGRECICWNCGDSFYIKKGHIQKSPKCPDCTGSKKHEKIAGVDVAAFLSSLLDKESGG